MYWVGFSQTWRTICTEQRPKNIVSVHFIVFAGWWFQSGSGAVSWRDRFCERRVVRSGTRWTSWQEWWSCSRDQVQLRALTKDKYNTVIKKSQTSSYQRFCSETCFPFRYFQCMPRYGLFAPVHKVTRIGFPCTTPTKAKSSRRRSNLKRSPSASSISSLSSATSSVSGKPSRAGLVRLLLCSLIMPVLKLRSTVTDKFVYVEPHRRQKHK